MPVPLQLNLTPAERDALEKVRDTHPKAYMRERAAAILKIADGMSGLQVSREGLLKPRDPDTIYRWVQRYQEAGIAGLEIRAGRGRKPAYFP
jgi:transposase